MVSRHRLGRPGRIVAGSRRFAFVPCLLAAALLQAQDAPDPISVLRSMEVQGEAAFSRDRIAMALVGDRVTWRALLRGVDADSATIVAERVRELHRCGGYAGAEATGSVSDGVLQIRLEAGTRYRCGEVRCSGNTAIDTATLCDRLTHPAAEPPPLPPYTNDEPRDPFRRTSPFVPADHPVWVAGEYPVMDEAAGKRVARIVGEVYRERGRHGARAEVQYVPEGDRMGMAVTIVDEGHEVRIRSLRLVGEDEAGARRVLAELPFAPDTLATSAALTALRRSLEGTARYLEVEMKVPEDAPALLDPLVIEVQRHGAEPPAVAANDVEQVRRALDAQVARLHRGDRLQLDVALSEALEWGPLRIGPGPLVVRWGRDGVAAETPQLRWGTRAPVKATVEIDAVAHTLAWSVGEHSGCLQLPASTGFQLQILTKPMAAGDMVVGWFIGAEERSAYRFDVDLHPATARHLLARATATQHDGDALALELAGAKVAIAADGALQGEHLDLVFSRCKITTSWVPAPSAASAPRDASHGVEALLRGASALLTECLPDSARSDPRVVAVVRAFMLALGNPPPADGAGADDPLVPQLPSPPGEKAKSPQEWIGVGVACSAVNRQCRGWLAQLSGAYGTLLLGGGKLAGPRFRAFVRGERGPLSLTLAAVAAGLLANESLAANLMDGARQNWSLAAIQGEVAEVAASLELLQWLPVRAGAAMREQPELRELCADLPAGADGDLLAWRRGFHLLWDAGGDQALREVLLGK